jgi:hypothetical protein
MAATLTDADLRDPAKFTAKLGVEVTQAHTRKFPEVKDANGRVVQPAREVTVTDAELPGIAAELNRRIAASGHLMPLTVGHRNFAPAAAETDQPPVAGFANNYRVGRVHTPDGKSHLAVLEDEYLYADTAAEHLRNFPYRSLDFDISRKTSEGTALLVRPPYIQMGTVVHYQAPGEPTVNPEDFDEATDAQPYAAFCDHMKGYGKKAGCYLKKYMAAMGPANADAPAPAPYSADPAVLAELAAVKTQLAAAEAARLDTGCRALLDPLKPYRQFDYNRELTALKGYADETARVGHVRYMVDNYLPLPGAGGMIRVADRPAPPGGDAAPAIFQAPKDHDAVMAYMREHPGLQYHEAKAALATAKT